MESLLFPLATVEQMLKVYSSIRDAYGRYCAHSIMGESFSPNEMNVLIFLSNNPSINTAKELTVTLGVSKGLVCRSTDSLIRQGYLISEEDTKDHRILHLRLTEKADPVIAQLRSSLEEFSAAVMKDITKEELEVYNRVQQQMAENIAAMIKGKKENNNDSVKEN